MKPKNNMKKARAIFTLIAFLALGCILLAGCDSGTVPPVDNGDDEQSWQTYENEELSFSLQYPEGWVYQENRGPAGMLPSLSFDIENAEHSDPVSFSIQEESIDEILQDKTTIQKSREEIVKNGLSWIKTIEQDKDTPLMFLTFLTNQGNKTYSFSTIYSVDSGSTLNQTRIDILKDMLNSLEFKN